MQATYATLFTAPKYQESRSWSFYTRLTSMFANRQSADICGLVVVYLGGAARCCHTDVVHRPDVGRWERKDSCLEAETKREN